MINNNAAIIGAGSFGETLSFYLSEQGYKIIGFFDDNQEFIGNKVNGYKILGRVNDLFSIYNKQSITHVFCAIGNNFIRAHYLSMAYKYGYDITNFIHKSVIINNRIIIGKGVYLLPGSVIMPFVKICDYTILSISTKVAHHSSIGRGSFLATGATIGANVIIDEQVFLGINSTIMTGVLKIGKKAIIGSGAVVTKNVEPYNVMAGVPARKINSKRNNK